MVKKRTKRINLTSGAIKRLATDSRTTVYDTRVPGLGVLTLPSGHKSFFWFRKIRNVPTWKTIGDFPALSVENARVRAQEFNAKLGRWKGDDYEGPNPFERKANLTLNDVLEHYVEHHLKKHSTNPDKVVKAARWQFGRYLTPWKGRRISSIRRTDVVHLHTEIGEKHGTVTANRLVTFLRTLFYHASESMAWAGENPAKNPGRRGSKRILVEESSRTRYVDEDEMAAFLDTLREEPNRDTQHFVTIALLTGARAGDILGMQWQQVEGDVWHVPNQKQPRHPYDVPLISEVMEVLERRQKKSAWVFPSDGSTGHLTTVKKSWAALLKRAEISGLRIHDLRRTLASWMAKTGASLLVISKALGHQTPGVTPIYAKVDLADVRAAIENAARAMLIAGKK